MSWDSDVFNIKRLKHRLLLDKRDARIIWTRNMLGGWKFALNPFTSVRKAIKRASGGDPVMKQVLTCGAFDNYSSAYSVSFFKLVSRSYMGSFSFLVSISWILTGHVTWSDFIYGLGSSTMLSILFTWMSTAILTPKYSDFDDAVMETSNELMNALINQEPFALEHALSQNGFTREEIVLIAAWCRDMGEMESHLKAMNEGFSMPDGMFPGLSGFQQTLLERACRASGVFPEKLKNGGMITSPLKPVFLPSDDLLSLGIGLSERAGVEVL